MDQICLKLLAKLFLRECHKSHALRRAVFLQSKSKSQIATKSLLLNILAMHMHKLCRLLFAAFVYATVVAVTW